MKVPNPDMIILARESRSMTQKDLAASLGVTQGKVSKMEIGLLAISPETVTRLSGILHYPESFFFRPESRLGLGPSELYHYRKRQNVPKRLLDSLHAQLNIRRMQLRGLLASVEMVTHRNFPRLDADEFDGDGAKVARALRAMWHVARGPIRNLTKLVEDAGGIVVLFDFGRDSIDAISRQVPDLPPLFFMNPTAGGARYRYTLAHELGHMIMHTIPNADMEDQADAFAAEFLMPEEDIRPTLSDVSLVKLANLTPHWRVSMAALLKRAGDLRKLTVRAERALWAQMVVAGYKTQEPPELDFPIEEPTLLDSIVNTHLTDLGYTIEQLTRVVDLFEDELVLEYHLGSRGLRVLRGTASDSVA